jgi:hypothetical protein
MPFRGSLEEDEEFFEATRQHCARLIKENEYLTQKLSAIQTKYDKLSVMFQNEFWDIDIMNK